MHSEIVIKKVTNNRELKKFISFQYDLYASNPYFAPPIFKSEYRKLHWKKNPAFAYCDASYWLAYRGEKIVGRIAAIINHRYNEKSGKKYLRWGWFECIKDQGVAGKLFDAVKLYAEENSLEYIHGPLGFINIDPEGLLIEGFDELATFASNYNMPYYQEFVESIGYEKDVDWQEYLLSLPEKVPEKIQKIARVVENRFGYHPVEAKTKSDLFAYAGTIMDLLEISYADLYGVVPYSQEQKKQIVRDFKPVIDPRYCCLVQDKNNQVIGFGLTMLSPVKAMQKIKGKLYPFGFLELLKSQRKNDRVELLLIGVLPEHRGKGVDAIIFNEIMPNLIDFGIKHVESNQMLEHNDKVIGLFKSYDARQHRRARCYITHI